MTFGLDEKAWNLWLTYRRQIRKPLKTASIELAQKRLAALGPQQLEAVEYSIANGYIGCFAPKHAKTVIRKMNSDATEMLELRVRAEKIGFRIPHDGEDLISYRSFLTRAEDADYWAQRRKNAPTPIAKLLGQP